MALERLRGWARGLKRDTIALWLAARDRRTPLSARLLAAVVAAYALSPIDLIPDFVPVLGLVDDLLIVPAGIWLVLHLIPAPLMASFRRDADQVVDRPVSRAGMVAIALVWLTTALVVARAIARAGLPG